VVEGVVRVVLGLDRGESPVDLIAVGLSNPAGIVVGIEEVDVDAGGAVWLEGFEESPRPRGLGCSELSGLFGEPRGPLAGNARCARARGRSYGAHRVPRLRREEVAVLAGEVPYCTRSLTPSITAMGIVSQPGNMNSRFAGNFKPSDGLEPSTPSLPFSSEAESEGERGPRRPRKPRKWGSSAPGE
jgi:hypothetical protein